jgi:uncharacterized protein DUF6538
MAILLMPRPWKHPETGMFYCRLRIPTPLKGHVFKPGKDAPLTEWRETLGTKDASTARRVFPDALGRAQEAFRAAQKRANAVVLTPQGAAHIAAKWAAWIAGGATLDMGGEDSDLFDAIVLPEARTPDNLTRRWDRVEFHATEALHLTDHDVPPKRGRSCSKPC